MQKGTLFVLISNSSLVCGEYFVVIVDIVFKFNYMMATQCSIMEDAHIMVIVTHKSRFVCVNIRNISQKTTHCIALWHIHILILPETNMNLL